MQATTHPNNAKATSRHRMCMVKSAALHTLLAEEFHTSGDLSNALAHYKQSLYRLISFSKRGDSSCNEASKKIRQNTYRIPYPKNRVIISRDAKEDAKIILAEGGRKFSSTPANDREDDDSTSEIAADVIVDNFIDDDDMTAVTIPCTAPGDSFLFEVAHVNPKANYQERCATIMFNMASIYFLLGNRSESVRLLNHLDEAHSFCTPEVFARMSNNLGYLHIQSGEYEEGIDLLTNALTEYWVKAGNLPESSTLSARLLFGIAKAEFRLGNYYEGIETYQNAMSLWFKGLGVEDGEGLVAPAA